MAKNLINYPPLRTGFYDRSYGYINVRATHGNWWSATAGAATDGHYLVTNPTYVSPQDNYYRGHGFAVRCMVREVKNCKVQ